MERDQREMVPDSGSVRGQTGTGYRQQMPVLITRRRSAGSGQSSGHSEGQENAGRGAGGENRRNQVSTGGRQNSGVRGNGRKQAGTGGGQRAVRTERRPAGTARRPAGTERRPAGTERRPVRTQRRPDEEAERAARLRAQQQRRKKEKERRAKQLRFRIILAGCLLIALAVFGVRFVMRQNSRQQAAELQQMEEQAAAASSQTDEAAEAAAGDPTPAEEEPAAVLEAYSSSDDDLPDIETAVNAGVSMSDTEVKRISEMLKRAAYPESLISLFEINNEARQFVLDYKTREEHPLPIDLSDEVTEGKIPLFLQWDERWGYETYGDDFLARTGCGPTCLAMVYAGLSGRTDRNPYAIASLADQQGYYVEGSGSSWEIMTRFADELGLEAEEIPFGEERILEELEAGHPIICAVGPGDFTDNGHFIVLTDVTRDGLIEIRDPNSYLRSQEEWDLEVLMDQMRDLWSFRYVAY